MECFLCSRDQDGIEKMLFDNTVWMIGEYKNNSKYDVCLITAPKRHSPLKDWTEEEHKMARRMINYVAKNQKLTVRVYEHNGEKHGYILAFCEKDKI